MESVKWRDRLRRLILADPRHRDVEPGLAGLAIVLGVWVGHAHDSRLYGFGVAALVLAIGKLLLYLRERRR